MKRMCTIVLAIAFLAGCESAPKESPKPAPAPLVVEAPRVEPKVVEVAQEPEAAPPSEPPKATEVAPVEAAAPAGLREVFPHVRVDVAAKIVQFDGVVPIDAHDAKAPWVFLEVVACTPDTKEHEAIVVTEAKSSHVHAALLLVGLEPGSPGKWTYENNELRPIAPKGDALSVTISYHEPDGTERTVIPEEMIVNAHDGKRFGAARPGKWVFAGSQIVTRAGKEFYDADGAGTLIGLTTFGSETIAWSEVISHEAAVEEPVWVADKKTTPKMGTTITVTIKRAG